VTYQVLLHKSTKNIGGKRPPCPTTTSEAFQQTDNTRALCRKTSLFSMLVGVRLPDELELLIKSANWTKWTKWKCSRVDRQLVSRTQPTASPDPPTRSKTANVHDSQPANLHIRRSMPHCFPSGPQKRRSSAMASLRTGEYQNARRDAPWLPGSTKSRPYMWSSGTGRIERAASHRPFRLARSPSTCAHQGNPCTSSADAAPEALLAARGCAAHEHMRNAGSIPGRPGTKMAWHRAASFQRAHRGGGRRTLERWMGQPRASRRSTRARSGPNTCCAADTLSACQMSRSSSANAGGLSMPSRGPVSRPSAPQGLSASERKQVHAECIQWRAQRTIIDRMQSDLLGMQNRTIGSCLAATHRSLIPVTDAGEPRTRLPAPGTWATSGPRRASERRP
jgi:hypothetical protein